MDWVKLVDEAIQVCAGEIKDGNLVVLTESDFKVLLSTKIKQLLKLTYPNLTVNTESPWYDEDTYQKQYIDITVFDQTLLNLSYSSELNRKGYRYDDEAVAIELKYFRYENDIREIEKDFQKTRLLLKSTKNFCYIIALSRTKQILSRAKVDMENWTVQYRLNFSDKVKVYLLGEEQVLQLNTASAP